MIHLKKLWINLNPFWKLVLIAVMVRLILLSLGILDYWGDAYHNMLIEKNSIDSNFTTYFDYKDRHLVWLPLFRLMAALYMKLTGSMDIQSAHGFSFLLFLAQIFPIYKMYQKKEWNFTLEKAALLFLMPLPILFSVYHLSEMLSFTIGVYLIWFLLIENRMGLFFASFAMVLTRHEATFLLMLISLLLLIRVNTRRLVIPMILGSAIGLSLWSFWVYQHTGNPFSWLISRVSASSAGASQFRIQHGWYFRFLEVIFSITISFPFLGYLKKEINWSFAGVLFMLSFLIAGNFLFHSADAKYLLVGLPVLILALDEVRLPKFKTLKWYLLLINMIVIPVFWMRSYNLEHELAAGRFLKTLPISKVWDDHPVSIYESNYKHDYYSTNRIQALFTKNNDSLAKVIDAENIRYIVYYDADRSYLYKRIPDNLNLDSEIEFEGVQLKKIYESKFEEVLNESIWILKPVVKLLFQDDNRASVFEVIKH